MNLDYLKPGINLVIDELDNCSTPSVLFFSETIDGNCPTIITRTYRIIDDCGNDIFVNHTITIDQLENDVLANISATPQEISSLNSTVNFINSTVNGTTYQWDFGDGSTISNVFEF